MLFNNYIINNIIFKYYKTYKIKLNTHFNNFNIKINFFIENLNLYKVIKLTKLK